MKKFAFPFLFFFFSSLLTYATGVAVVDGQKGEFFKTLSSAVKVTVNNQVAIVTTTQVFENTSGADTLIKYGFPMPETASATQLRWKLAGNWYEADFSPDPQDTTLPGTGTGGSVNSDLKNYLGNAALYFDLKDTIWKDSLLIVELTYVQLLPYKFNKVTFHYPSDYSLIQTEPLDHSFDFDLQSSRTITDVSMDDHPTATLLINSNTASVDLLMGETSNTVDYQVQYELSSSELGLFSFSTFLPDSQVHCDNYGNGYFSFIVEPESNDSAAVIEKVFTLIIDRSGSMSGDKIVQARNAASFIMENLNIGDQFNIVDFSSTVTSFKADHVPFNAGNLTDALDYIAAMNASGGTNISGSFETAIPQFAASDPNVANIIIFFTDGQATSGITDTPGILNKVKELKQQHEVDLNLFTFGIGAGANKQLLTLLATENNGLAEFLGNNELADVISDFYLTVRNPVLLNTTMTFDPPIIVETYPRPLPNLYKGNQLVVVGRYDQADAVKVTLSGSAFGKSVSYDYHFNLADTLVSEYQFLPKLWAKNKIDYLQTELYSMGSSSTADSLEDYIKEMSTCYEVISDLTSFTGGGNTGGGVTSIEEMEEGEVASLALNSYPNPFREHTTIRFEVKTNYSGLVQLKIYDSFGRLVQMIDVDINGAGNYEVLWDGSNGQGIDLPAGTYQYVIDFGVQQLRGMSVKLNQ